MQNLQNMIDNLNTNLKLVQAAKDAAIRKAESNSVSEYDCPLCALLFDAEDMIADEIKRLVLLNADYLNNV